MTWRDTADGMDWKDTGPAEFRRADGTTVRGRLSADEFWTGEEEVPVPSVELDSGEAADFFAFASFRPIKS